MYKPVGSVPYQMLCLFVGLLFSLASWVVGGFVLGATLALVCWPVYEGIKWMGNLLGM